MVQTNKIGNEEGSARSAAVVFSFQLTSPEIGRRDRPGRLWRKTRRLGHELLSDFADFQLQALLAREDVAVGQLGGKDGLIMRFPVRFENKPMLT